jgi:glutaminyl-peptide cyclotransferase
MPFPTTRHLAEKWATTYILPNSKRRLVGPQATEISTIEHLILLDLLGAPQPTIRSYYIDTAWLFDAMASAERRLGAHGAFVYGDEKGMAPNRWKSYFLPRTANDRNLGYVGDDHIPFLHKGVSVVHVIAEPFPFVWHTLKVRMFVVNVVEYMLLRVS